MMMHAALNRKLHVVAAEFGGPARAHEIVKLFAREELGVESVAQLTNAQAQELIKLIRAARNDAQWNVRFAIGDDTDEPMSARQRAYLADLKAKLNWSDEYMNTLITNRWGEYLHHSQQTIATLPRWAAVRLIALMKQRVQSKQSTQSKHPTSGGNKDEVQRRHSDHTQGAGTVQRDLSLRPAAENG